MNCNKVRRMFLSNEKNNKFHCLIVILLLIFPRKCDYENFLCTLLLPREIRTVAFAIRAFNVEVAQIQDQVHDYKIGEMRLKFWTDAINNTYKGNPPRSPVMLELNRV